MNRPKAPKRLEVRRQKRFKNTFRFFIDKAFINDIIEKTYIKAFVFGSAKSGDPAARSGEISR